MKILFTRFPLESAFGGAEVQTISLMKGLIEKGYEVEFMGSCETLISEIRNPIRRDSVAPRQESEIRNKSEIRNFKNIYIKKIEIGIPPVTKFGAISFLWRKINMRKKLINGIKDDFPDVIFMLSLSEKLLLTDYAVKRGAKVIWIEHDRVGRWLRMNPWLPLLRKLSRNAKTICVSDLTRDEYLKMGWKENDVVTILNGIEGVNSKSEIRNPPARTGSDGKYKKIGCIARLTYDKGVDLLIKAMKELPEMKLSILGRGREEKKLKSLISKEGLLERVEIINFVEDVESFYESIDLLVLPTRDHDTFGLVVAEAMIRGIPVVCTKECGIYRHLEEGTDSIICDANSSKALVEAIKKLSDEDLRKRISKNGKRVAEDKFTVKRMVEDYLKIIN